MFNNKVTLYCKIKNKKFGKFKDQFEFDYLSLYSAYYIKLKFEIIDACIYWSVLEEK